MDEVIYLLVKKMNINILQFLYSTSQHGIDLLNMTNSI
jgi:hypothetical protein